MAAGTPEPWSRQRLGCALAAIAVVMVMLLVGVAIWVARALTSGDESMQASRPTASEVHGQQERDRVAAEPMLQVDPVDARQGTPAAAPAPTMRIPSPTKVGAAEVPTGFPQSPEGAVGQLAAIAQVVTEGMSIPHAAAVHDEWAMPGAGSAADWQLTENVRVFLESAQLSGQEAGSSVTVMADPVAAQIKGHDGDTWVLACVLFDVKAVVAQEARTGWGHCERMQWHDGAWKIAPGQRPAPAPSTWPGSQKAIEAGWRTWVEPEKS
ncbi:hypothetical protein ACRTEC_16550 [Janibacter indicus]|uniref:Uncharacterized protein n=1 Tax=Janibacter indicus TaxID=857417 RepID=A0A7L9IYK0_9MICO|nr:hypothetical protein [Janibacter indicus]QOK22358.1 hypothetical protein IGS73_14905 [Janibacter indicus]